MSVLAHAEPTMFDSQHDLMVKANEYLILNFTVASPLTPSPSDSLNTLMYKLAYNISQASGGSGAGAIVGTGSPEGVETGDPGTSYFDITDPDHPIQWVKTTGTGDTGWILFVST